MKMMKIAVPLFAALLHAGCHAKAPIDADQFLKSQGWTAVEDSKPVTSPGQDIVGIQYYAKGSSVPSCGLITSSAKAKEGGFIELVGSEPGENFPQCLGISSISTFKLATREYVAVDYEYRDTTEDSDRRYYYLYRDPEQGFVVDKPLAKQVRALLRRADTLAKLKSYNPTKAARAAHFAAAYPQWRLLENHLVSDDASSFAALDNAKSQQCQFVVEAGAEPLALPHTDVSPGTKCSAVLATTRLEQKGTIYYLGMFKADARQLVAVASVASGGKFAAEKALAEKINQSGFSGNIKDARGALAKLLK